MREGGIFINQWMTKYMMQMIFTCRSRSTGRKADSGSLKEAMTFLMASNKGNTEASVEMLPLYILPAT